MLTNTITCTHTCTHAHTHSHFALPSPLQLLIQSIFLYLDRTYVMQSTGVLPIWSALDLANLSSFVQIYYVHAKFAQILSGVQ